MTWVLFETADDRMMLVKKRNKSPKRKPAARNLQANDPPPLPSLPSPPANANHHKQQAYEAEIRAHIASLPFEHPPPYSLHQKCPGNNVLSRPNAIASSQPAQRIPPPLPPRAPVRALEPVKTPNSVQLGKSCPDLARLVAKSVQNVKDSMNQEQDKKAIAKSIRDAKENLKQDHETKPTIKSPQTTKDSLDRAYELRAIAKAFQNGKESMSQQREDKVRSKPSRSVLDHNQKQDRKTLTKAMQSIKQSVDQGYDKKVRPNNSPCPLQTALEELISTKLDAVLTSIDGEEFSGNEKDLDIYDRPQSGLRGGWGSASRVSQGANRAISSTIIGINYFKKANLYANSMLPPNLPALRLYMPSYPLLCLAAQYSQRVYTKPAGKEREAHVEANWKMGTKAMVIKSVPVDDMNTIVFAIRGSQTFMDWAVNLNSAPVSPGDFLDDSGNLCHSGFLSVARKMIRPVAARLRSLLEEDPSRSSCSLLMTGHSAGGAVASLLYAHMLAEDVKSELNILTGCFKRIHCLTFGAPPVSLLPLTKPTGTRLKKSLFLSFINEGDPVPRADKAYIRSLVDLYTSPAPSIPRTASPSSDKPQRCALGFARPKNNRAISAPAILAPPPPQQYVWAVPPGALSNAGRLVVLRGEKVTKDNLDDDVRAEITTDQQLRGCVFGDPVMHMMKVYARRIEVLATKAVTAKVWG